MKLLDILREQYMASSKYRKVEFNDPMVVIKALLDSIVSGEGDRFTNPYTIPTVKKALDFYKKKAGKEYELNENKKKKR